MKKLYIGKLPYQTTETDLRSLFEQYGPIISLTIIKDSNTGQSRGFGFIELENDELADEAIQALNGYTLGNFQIIVNEAREDRGGGRGGGSNQRRRPDNSHSSFDRSRGHRPSHARGDSNNRGGGGYRGGRDGGGNRR